MNITADPLILIIDDNEDIGFMLRTMLNLKGYSVEIRTNPHKLEETLREMKPDLILMDMLLSGSDGREVCNSLKSNSEFSAIPIIMISAHPTAREDCMNAGSDFFLAKPFDMKDLFGLVQHVLTTNNIK